MYVCIYICIYGYIYIHIYVYMYMYMYVYIRTSISHPAVDRTWRAEGTYSASLKDYILLQGIYITLPKALNSGFGFHSYRASCSDVCIIDANDSQISC